MLLGTMGLALWSLLEVRPQCANSTRSRSDPPKRNNDFDFGQRDKQKCTKMYEFAHQNERYL